MYHPAIIDLILKAIGSVSTTVRRILKAKKSRYFFASDTTIVFKSSVLITRMFLLYEPGISVSLSLYVSRSQLIKYVISR